MSSNEHRTHVRSVDFPNGTILGFLGECSCGWKGQMQYMAKDAAADASLHAVCPADAAAGDASGENP